MGYVGLAQTPEQRSIAEPKSGANTSVTIAMDPGGGVTVQLDSTPNGQGHATVAAQIVAQELGLTPAGEDDAAQTRIALLAAAVSRQVDLERLLAATVSHAPLSGALPRSPPGRVGVRIGIARDRAFGFYYPDDLEALERAGAELIFFDTLRDARLPRVDGLVIGGGFPEMFMRELEGNAALRGDILEAIEAGMPAYAECGGLMYLARSLSWRGDTRRMVGAIAGDVVMHERPVGRGYVKLTPTADHPWGGRGEFHAEIPAHEFHYSSIDGLAPDTRFAYRVARGFGTNGKSDGIVVNNLLANYAHLRSAGDYDWAALFVGFVHSRSGRRTPPPVLAAAH